MICSFKKIKTLNWRKKVKNLKKETYILYLAYKEPRVSWYSKLFIGIVVGYALSPIDLIPDFIPIFGYLDDMILLPIGIILALKMIPNNIIEELRSKAEIDINKDSKIAVVIIITIWIIITFIISYYLVSKLNLLKGVIK